MMQDSCRKCGRTIGRGSMTAWIFNGKGGCTCIIEDTPSGSSPSATKPKTTFDNKKLVLGQKEFSNHPVLKVGPNLNTERDLDLKANSDAEPELNAQPDQNVAAGAVVASRYKLDELIGTGGMGSVYKAKEQGLDKTFAVKLLRSDLVADNAAVRRFEREAKAISSLTHPNLVAVYDYGVTDGQAYLVMDFLDGTGLDKILRENVYLDSHRAVPLFVQAADALAHAHAKRVVHRDIKPSNIIVLPPENGCEFVKIVDFGIAKILPEGDARTQTLTQTGEVFGSPFYMSPEQCLAGKVDGRSDIYSLGCVMYEMLCGSPPLQGENPIHTILQHINEAPGDLRQNYLQLGISEDISYVVMRCLEKHPDDRYQSADELKSDLEQLLAGKKLERVQAKKRKLEFKTQKLGFFHSTRRALAICLAVLVGMIVVSGVALLGFPGLDSKVSPNDWGRLDYLGQAAFDRGELKAARGYFDEALLQAESTSKAGGSQEYLEGSLNELLDLARATGATQDEQFLLARLAVVKAVGTDNIQSIERQLNETIRQPSSAVTADLSSLIDRANDSIGSLIEGEHYPEARAFLDKVNRLSTRNESDRIAAIRCRHNSAYLDHESGNYDNARKQYREALELERKHLRPGHPFIAQTLLMMARLGMQDGKDDRRDVEKWLKEALSIYQTEARRDQMAWVRYHLGLYYEWLGQPQKAAAELEAALTIYRNLPDVDPKYVARCYSLLGRIKDEPDYIKQAVELYEHQTRKDYGSLLSALQDYAGAVEAVNPQLAEHLTKRAYAISWRTELKNRSIQQAEIQKRLANLYRRRGDYKAAIKSAKLALELNRTAYGAESYRAFQSLVWLGALFDDAGDVNAASTRLESAYRIYQRKHLEFSNSQAASELLARYKLILIKTGRAWDADQFPIATKSDNAGHQQ